MKSIMQSVYHAMMPARLQKYIGTWRVRQKDKILLQKISECFSNSPLEPKYQEELHYFYKIYEKNLHLFLPAFPYEFIEKYLNYKPKIFYERVNGLHYVLHNGKKLFFPNDTTKLAIEDAYRTLLIEQDTQSPHRYLSEASIQGKPQILLDIGCAEAILSLDMVEQVEHIYLFEYNPRWHDALKATFYPWEDKVTLIQKYVSDKNEGSNITLDSMQFDPEKTILLKMDIEGAERTALEGMPRLLERNNVKFLCCTYHRIDDAAYIENFFKARGYHTEFTAGYMFWRYDNPLQPPFFRKCVLRSWK